MGFGPLLCPVPTNYEDHFQAQGRSAERIKSLGGHAEGPCSRHCSRARRSPNTTGTRTDGGDDRAMQTAQETLATAPARGRACRGNMATPSPEDLCFAAAAEPGPTEEIRMDLARPPRVAPPPPRRSLPAAGSVRTSLTLENAGRRGASAARSWTVGSGLDPVNLQRAGPKSSICGGPLPGPVDT